MGLSPFRGASRNADLGSLHETFFVAAVTTILCIRTELWLTNYPQLGGHGLHIAHLLWGGLLMVIAIAILLSLLGRRARWPAALLAGVGFGFFIDELGKFITSDNNYFFRPAAGIIYLVFVSLFLLSRAYQRYRGLTEAERVRNAIELIGEASIGSFHLASRERAERLLGEVAPTNPLRAPLLDLLEGIRAVPDPSPSWYRRSAAAIARRYESWARASWFHGLVACVFVVWAATGIVTIVGLVLGSDGDSLAHLSFVNVADLSSLAVSTALVVIGLLALLRGERLAAYDWLSRALLVSIFVTRVFSFVESQFGAVLGLGVDVLLLVTVGLMSRQESLRAAGGEARRRDGAPARPVDSIAAMTTCVVTGGAGFLGSHLCEHLLGKGYRVICLDNLETGSLENIEHIRDEAFEFRNFDITSYVEVPEPVDFVYHLASPASPIDYLRLPLHTLKVGSHGTHHMLGVAKWKRARFLIASTSEVYGDPQVHPQQEDYWGHVNPIGPRGVYDEAKRYAEALTMAYHRQQGVDTAIVRIFNTYGPRMRPHDGRAIPTFLRQALQDRPITVFGDGSQTRSFCYVDDLIRGIVALGESDVHVPVNVGNPNEFTLLELAEAVVEVTGSKSEIVYEALPTDDPKQRRPDIGRAKESLGWQPEVELVEGLRRTIEQTGRERLIGDGA